MSEPIAYADLCEEWGALPLWPGPRTLLWFNNPPALSDPAYSPDAPVQNEIHYHVLCNRALRFSARPNEIDLDQRPFFDRVVTIEEALERYDAQLPLSTLRFYESRLGRVKQYLRTHDHAGYPEHYAELQRELRWLKWRTTQIYQARCRNRPPSPAKPTTP